MYLTLFAQSRRAFLGQSRVVTRGTRLEQQSTLVIENTITDATTFSVDVGFAEEAQIMYVDAATRMITYRRMTCCHKRNINRISNAIAKLSHYFSIRHLLFFRIDNVPGVILPDIIVPVPPVVPSEQGELPTLVDTVAEKQEAQSVALEELKSPYAHPLGTLDHDDTHNAINDENDSADKNDRSKFDDNGIRRARRRGNKDSANDYGSDPNSNSKNSAARSGGAKPTPIASTFKRAPAVFAAERTRQAMAVLEHKQEERRERAQRKQ